MTVHSRLSPGIEIHEIDRSQYGEKTDYSVVGTTVFMAGFTDKGKDSQVQWVNTKKFFVSEFGYPTNEPERYLYNGVCDVLDQGGVCLVAKLPYVNDSKDKFCYIDFKIENFEPVLPEEDSEEENLICKDGSINALKQIVFNGQIPRLMSLDEFDKCRIHNSVNMSNTIRIVDITRSQLGKATVNQTASNLKSGIEPVEKQCLGICPVLVGAANAASFQNLLNDRLSVYNPVSDIYTVDDPTVNNPTAQPYNLSLSAEKSMDIMTRSSNKNEISLSRIAVSEFPVLNWISDGRLERKYLKHIGLVVFRLSVDPANESRIIAELVEVFTGSLDRNSKNSSGASDYLGDIVNRNSRYVNLFMNINSKTQIANTDMFVVLDQPAYVMGFRESQCAKSISYNDSIITPLRRILDQMQDPNQIPLDIIADAGVSNVAQWTKDYAGADDRIADSALYPFMYSDDTQINWTMPQTAGLGGWQAVLKMFDDFCKNVRKDCMFIADGPRPLVLDGNEKVVRNTNVLNTIENKILTHLNQINALNSSYSAGYCNWFLAQDQYSQDFFWIPPSIKMSGVYIYTDTYAHTWNAPAGLTRGVVRNVYDVSFNPMNDQAGKIYQQAWNYAVNYPIAGIVAEGQKTFQLQQTALDRVNVRRLMLYLEKRVVEIARRFLYEGNTEYTRQRFVDTIQPILEELQTGDGVSEYAVKCDNELNTPEVIDNHELRCIIGIKPIKAIEWIRLDFMVTNQRADVSEEIIH